MKPKRKIIALEGPDNIGKSRLVKLIQEEHPEFTQVDHFPAPVSKGAAVLREQINRITKELDLLNCCGDEDQYIIWDRSPIGEEIYGPLFRKNQYDHSRYWDFLKDLKQYEKQIFILVFYADEDTYLKFDLKSKSDEVVAYQRQEQAQRIATRFVDTATKLDLHNTIYVNCNNYDTLDDRNKYLLRRIRLWLMGKKFEYSLTQDHSQTFFNVKQRVWIEGQGFVKWPHHCVSYQKCECLIGCNHRENADLGIMWNEPSSACGGLMNVKYIFVGEAPSQFGGGKYGFPFYNDASGCLLHGALDRLGVHPTQYYMTNAIKCWPLKNDLKQYGSADFRRNLECVSDLKIEIKDVLKKSPKAQIIGLGKVAEEVLARLDFEHRIVYHPAYYLRIGKGDLFFEDLKGSCYV